MMRTLLSFQYHVFGLCGWYLEIGRGEASSPWKRSTHDALQSGLFVPVRPAEAGLGTN